MTVPIEIRRRTPAGRLSHIAEQLAKVSSQDSAGQVILIAARHLLEGLAEELGQLPGNAGFPTVQGRCPACSASSLFLGAGGHVTCSRRECPSPAAADDVLHRQTIGQWPGTRCEITIDVFSQGSKRQLRRLTPMHDDMSITRFLLAEELRQLADRIERLGLDMAGGQQ